MKAAAMEGFRRPLVIRDLPDPPLPEHGARVQVKANGICRSDWHTWVGDWSWMGAKFDFPFVLGHEFCGVVVEVGRVCTRFKPGDRVIVPFSQGEGSCEQCLSGNHHVCEAGPSPGWSYWGGYGERVAVPHADINLVSLPQSVDFVEAASLGCRFMTSFHGLIDRAQVRPGEWVAVHGCGGIGLSAVQIATAAGGSVIAVDIDAHKLEAARGQGAVAVINASVDDPVAAIRDMTRGGVQVAVDALGIEATCRNAILSLRKRGRHLQIGLTGAAEQGDVSVPIDFVVTNELTLLGSMGMAPPRFGSMLELVERGMLRPGALVSRTVPLEEAGSVLASMDEFGTLGMVVIDRY
ncbi:MAG TPA: zinc-dependent alcohol dehydrogenase family protein [Alphaproteobacteria bacterium]|nr:zinc-dependent alcohol dehydrogenase family protein [Alphaproteobacteria bacterium]